MPTKSPLPASDSKTAIIRVIFTNVLFVIGVILLVIGFVQGSLTAAKMVIFEKYPLNSYEESRCDASYFATPKPVAIDDVTPIDTNSEEYKQQQTECKRQLEFDRKVRQTEDIVGSISFLVAGAALTIVFRRFIFEKLSL